MAHTETETDGPGGYSEESRIEVTEGVYHRRLWFSTLHTETETVLEDLGKESRLQFSALGQKFGCSHCCSDPSKRLRKRTRE